MRAVAERARLSVRTLYNRFGSKREIFTALTSRALDQLAAELEALSIDEPLDLSRAIISVSIDRFDADREVMRPLLAATDWGSDAADRAILFHQARSLQETAIESAMRARMLSRLVPARALAHQILASYNQAATTWSQGSIDREAFRTQALHAWGCLLLGVARGSARKRLVAELETLEGPMRALAGDPARRSIKSA